ncbi:hypothetical protein [Nitriliruptor alkaliphilus]|uniref:hypothetical protein n=1 Tax=Nitriliruptor alkaliphilus TaxID=427918 RepID=UPI000697532D|nr:hypothetical protein [Nitriliruptor alkaliphilus]
MSYHRRALLLALATVVASCTGEPTIDDVANDTAAHVILDTGLQVVVGDVRFEDDLVRVPLQVWNGSPEDVAFAAGEPELEDPSGTPYTYEAPEPATDLFTRSGQVAQGVLVFRRAPREEGAEPRSDPDRVSLVLNPRTSGAPTIELPDLRVTR